MAGAPAHRPSLTQGFEYRAQSGQCCGMCVQVACVSNSSNSPAQLFYVSSGCRVAGGTRDLG